MRDTLDDLKERDAARDIDLVAFYELEVFDKTHTVPPRHAEFIGDMDEDQVAQLHGAICREYDLSLTQMNRVLGHCLAGVVGIKLGADFFDG